MSLNYSHFASSPNIPSLDRRVRRHRQIFGLMAAVLLAVSPILANSGRFAYKDDLLGLSNVSTYARLDPTFNASGRVKDSFGPNSHLNTSMVVLPDGKIVVAGMADFYSIGLIRYNADGTRDNTFGTNGRVTNAVVSEGGALLVGWPLALQPDGKLLVGGTRIGMLFGPNQTFVLSRFNADGSREWLNGSLHVPGPVWTGIGEPPQMVSTIGSVALQADGKVIAAGGVGYGNRPAPDRQEDFALVRVNADGTSDATFGTDGGVRTRLSDDHDHINKVLLQSDGKILAVGYAINAGTKDLALARFNTNGTLDATFDGDGMKTISVASGNDQGLDAVIQTDGKIVVAGEAQNGPLNEVLVARFNADGSFDNTFGGGDGSKLIGFYSQSARARAISLLSNGKIVVAGTADNGNNRDLAVVRLNADGSLDKSFDLDGRAMFDLGGTTDVAHDLAIYDSGRIAISGESGNEIAVARISTDVSISNTPYDFNADGRADLAVYRPSNNLWYVQTADAFYTREWGEAGDALAPADYDGDGRTDFAVFRPSNGTWYVMTSETYTFQATQWGQNGDLPTAADMNADGRADLALFRASSNTWFTKFASGGSKQVQFGEAGDKPVKGDFDGDGVPDLSVYRPSDNTWRIERSTDGPYVFQWGAAGDVTVPADYDGDGKTDLAVWRPSTGQWFRINSTEGIVIQSWGVAGDVPVPADYDGDGRTELAVFRPSNGLWYIVNSADNTIYLQQFGQTDDLPIPAAYHY